MLRLYLNLHLPGQLDKILNVIKRLFYFGKIDVKDKSRCVQKGILALSFGVGQVLGATLVVAGPGLPTHFDPDVVSDPLTRLFVNSTYQALVETNEMGEIQPGLADHWERVDPLTWRFHLRSDATFPQGEILTAPDVIFSFERARRPSSPWRSVLRFVKSVKSVNSGRSVDISLSVADPQWLRVLSLVKIVGRQCCIPGRHGQTASGMDQHGILRKSSYGTGAFQAKRWPVPGKGFAKVMLIPTGRLHDDLDPWWEHIEYIGISSDEQRLESLMKGQVQVALDIAPERVHASVLTEAKARMKSVSVPSSRLLVMVWPWSTLEDRQDVLNSQMALLKRLHQPMWYKKHQWIQPDMVWNTFWRSVPGDPGKRDDLEVSGPLVSSVSKSDRPLWAGVFDAITDRGSLYTQANAEMIRLLRDEGSQLTVNTINVADLETHLEGHNVQASLIEWAPYTEDAVASLLGLIQVVCPQNITADISGCKGLWTAYENLADPKASVPQVLLSDKLFPFRLSNQEYGWWLPVARMRLYDFYQKTLTVVPRYDGEIDFNDLVPDNKWSNTP